MAEKKTYSDRAYDVVGTSEDNPDRKKLMKTRPGFFKDERHTQESIMRGLEEADVAEKGMVGKALNRLKTNVMGSAVDNELAAERETAQAAKNPEGNQAKFRKMIGMKKGGKVSSYKSGGSVKSASSRADGCAIRGKTRA
jgi:hypothetical protein